MQLRTVPWNVLGFQAPLIAPFPASRWAPLASQHPNRGWTLLLANPWTEGCPLFITTISRAAAIESCGDLTLQHLLPLGEAGSELRLLGFFLLPWVPHTTATVSRQRAKMSKVAKYRRQVSEDPDIDSLLSTLSPEEMEELEKELDVVEPDGSIPLELSQKNQSENSSPGPQNCDTTLNHCEKESRKRIQREHSVDVSPISSRLSWFCQKRGGKSCRIRAPAPVLHRPRRNRGETGGARQGAAPGGNGLFCEIPVYSQRQNQSWCQGYALCLGSNILWQGWEQRWCSQKAAGGAVTVIPQAEFISQPPLSFGELQSSRSFPFL